MGLGSVGERNPPASLLTATTLMPVLETTQYKLYTHWFSGAWLGLIIAIDLAWISVTSVCARLAAVPMSRINGWYGYALWIPNVITVGSFLAVVAYWWLERSIPERYRPLNESDVRAGQRTGSVGVRGVTFAVRNMLNLYVNTSDSLGVVRE